MHYGITNLKYPLIRFEAGSFFHMEVYLASDQLSF